MKTKILTASLLSLFISSGAYAASFNLNPANTSVPVASASGTGVTLVLSYDNTGTLANSIQADVEWDVNQLTYVSHSGAGCSNPAPHQVRTVRADLDGNVYPSEDRCTVNLALNSDNAGVAWADGDVLNITVEGQILYHLATDVTGDLDAPQNATITIVAEGPPTLTFDTTPVALPGGPFGSTQSGTIPANFTASTGAHSVDYTCTAPAGFTVTPATGSYDNDDTTATDLTVTATLTGAAQTGTVTCTVTPSDGSTPTTFDIDVSAPAGAETAPVLDPTPASGGTVTVGGGAPGSNGTGTLVVTPDGGAGTDVAEVSCTADAPVSISPASLSFPVGSSPQNFTVTVPLTDAAQSFPGAITCSGTDGNGIFEWVFDVSAPAGVAAPTFIPATSLWSKFALIGVFAALGLLMVGLRRNH